MKGKMTKILSLALCLALRLTLFGVTAFAIDNALRLCEAAVEYSTLLL